MTPLHVDLDQFTHRLLQDALAEATAVYWQRRAATFDAVGTAAAAETAQACRNAAVVAEWPEVES